MGANDADARVAAPPLVIVCGLGRFGLRVAERLREAGAEVAVVTDSATRSDRVRRAEEMGVTVHVGDFRFAGRRAAAGIGRARAVVLAAADDAANLEAALDIRAEAPDVRIVMRQDEGRFPDRLEADFGIDAVLSPAALAAPEFSRAALDDSPLPAASACTAGGHGIATARRHAERRPRRPGLADRYDPRRPVQIVALGLLVLFGVAVAVFHATLGLPWVDAVYFTATILTTVGFGDYHLKDHGPALKLFGTVLMFAGVTLVAMLTSVLTNFFLSGAAATLRADYAARRARGHVILCGLGSVGYEIARDLTGRGVPLVVIDSTPDDDYARRLGEDLRVPLLYGDATRSDLLLRAGLPHARAVISAVSSDAVSLEIGLAAQTLAEETRPPGHPLRIVLRCFDPDLARRIHALSAAYTLLSSAEISAPLFARAATSPVRAAGA
jgi:voltage-gated potassium channel Kch